MLMCYTFTPDSVFKLVLPKTQNRLDKPVCFTHANVLLSYVNETVFAWKTAFLQDSCHSFCGPGQLTWCQGYLKMHVVSEGPGAILWVFRHFLSLISRLLVVIWHLAKDQQGGTLSAPFWCLCQRLSLSPLYFNKTLLQINLNLKTHYKLLLISK